jgi:hypothetical protein
MLKKKFSSKVNPFIQKMLNIFGFRIKRVRGIGYRFQRIPKSGSEALFYITLQVQETHSNLKLSAEERSSWKNFRNGRYFYLNELRWRLFLQTGIPIAGQTIFEPGAGIGDQTQWLLQQGASKIIVSDGRLNNIEIIRKRFYGNQRVLPILTEGNLEICLDQPEFQLKADLIFLWGVYYHINDPMPEFLVLKRLTNIAPVIALDYLESATGTDYIEVYNYENPSASISHASGRQTRATMIEGLRLAFGYVYFPVEQMNWHDPSAPSTPRRIIIGSRSPLHFQGLIEAK